MTIIDKMEKWFSGKIRPEVAKWFTLQGQNIYERYYLYFTSRDIKISADAPGAEWQLARPERVSPAWTTDHAYDFCRRALKNCPCLPENLEF